MESTKIVEELRRRVVRNFLDILLLAEMKNKLLSGYDAITLAHEKFSIFVSSGAIYGLLHSMEREGLIKGIQNGRRTVYEQTEKAEQDTEVIAKVNDEIQGFLKTCMHSCKKQEG